MSTKWFAKNITIADVVGVHVAEKGKGTGTAKERKHWCGRADRSCEFGWWLEWTVERN